MSASAMAAKSGRPYVLIWSGSRAIADDTLTLVGPFTTHDAAAAWATAPRNNPTDDPSWQTFNLCDPRVMVLPPGPRAEEAARSIFPATLEPVGMRFGVPYTEARLLEEQTAALMELMDQDLEEFERSDVIRDSLRHFAHLVLGLPKNARGLGG
jgi:hypothetical protein